MSHVRLTEYAPCDRRLHRSQEGNDARTSITTQGARMRTRILAIGAGLMLAGALAPAANASITKTKTEPPSCHSTIGNYVNGDPLCEQTD
jgi:hypothetical protein